MRRSPSALIAFVVPPAVFVYGVLGALRDIVGGDGTVNSDLRGERSRGSAPRFQDASPERVGVRPRTRRHYPADLRPGLEPAPAHPRDGRAESAPRRRRRIAISLIALGVVIATYAAAVVLWRDPVTDVYARWKQAEIEDALGATFAQYDEPLAPASSASRALGAYAVDPDAYARAESAAVARAARRMTADIRLGQPIGRIAIPSLGVRAVFVHGTRWGPDLSRGPGHYKETPLPGVGKTSAIAAHRTTFGAWFRHIDELRRGHRITIALPYATFEYEVFAHKIVDDRDWSIIENRGFDALVLSACHPLYSAEQRWVVFARLTYVKPRGGKPYALTPGGDPISALKT